MDESKYTVVTDQGGNKGARCKECNTARWTVEHNVIDPMTGQVCSNCELMKYEGLVAKLNE